jgi:Tol biopolymer transport system component
VHRDLKPANIRVRHDGAVKVLDFGPAKAVEPGSGPDVTSSPTLTSPVMVTSAGTLLGTAAYMSPEQARGRPVDRRADIWAFGVVVFELLTGARLFEGDTVSDTVAAVLRQDIPWDRLPPATPARLTRLLRHCLDRDPRNRLRDAGDARLELDDLIGTRAADPDAPAPPAAPPSSARTLERVGWIALAAASAGLTWWAAASQRPPARDVWSQFTAITNDAGREATPAISPDGAWITYASDAAGSWDIYVRRIGGNATRVAGDPNRNEGAPAFSPDGRTIAFHEADIDGGIFIVGATGESERRIGDAGFHPAWSPDGRLVAFCQERIVDPRSRVITSALSIIDVATGDVRVVTKGDAVQPVWAPTGTHLAYWAQVGGQRDIYTIAAAGGEPIKITDDPALDWSVVWAPDGRHLYFASDRGGAMNLWRIAVDADTGRPHGPVEPVTSGVHASVATPSFSRDGTKLVFSSTVSTSEPMALPLDAAAERFGEPKVVLRQHGLVPSSVSPDGSMLLYASISGVEDIWIGRADGTSLRRLTDDPHRDRVPVFSPDGKAVAFYSNRGGRYDVWTVRTDGSGLRQVSQGTGAASVWYPFYDPAGGRLFASLSGSRATMVFSLHERLPQPGTELPPIAVDGGTFRVYRINPAGTHFAGLATSADGVRIGVGWHALRSGETWVTRQGLDIGAPAWLDDTRVLFPVDGRSLAIADTAKRQRVVAGPFPFEISMVLPPAVAPDLRTVFIAGVSNEVDVWMVERQK